MCLAGAAAGLDRFNAVLIHFVHIELPTAVSAPFRGEHLQFFNVASGPCRDGRPGYDSSLESVSE